MPVIKKYDGIKVIKYAVGSKAIEMIKSIHWHPEDLKGMVNGVVALYDDGSVLWLALFKDPKTANSLEQKMVNAINRAQGRIPYLRPIPHEGFYIIPDVRGSYHVLWREGRCLIWLQLGNKGMELLKYVYQFYRPICLGR